MFFHPSIYHYAPLLIRFWLSFGAGKKQAYTMVSFMAFLRRHIVIFGVVEFYVGLVTVSGLMLRLSRDLIIVCISP